MDDRWFRLGDHGRYHAIQKLLNSTVAGIVRFRKFTFTLRSFLILITLGCVFVGYRFSARHDALASIAAIENEGGRILYVWQYPKYVSVKRSTGPRLEYVLKKADGKWRKRYKESVDYSIRELRIASKAGLSLGSLR